MAPGVVSPPDKGTSDPDFSLVDVLMVTSFTHTLAHKCPSTQARKRPSHRHPDRNYVHVPVEWHFSPPVKVALVRLTLYHTFSSADSEPVKMRKEPRRSLSASLVRQQDAKQYAGLMVLQTHPERRKSRYDEMSKTVSKETTWHIWYSFLYV